jgi:hypothetical protein
MRAGISSDVARQAEYWFSHIISVGTPKMPKVPTALIAKLTKRTEGSLRQKARKLYISLGHRRKATVT